MSAQTTVDAWIAREAIQFTTDAPESIDGAVDRIVGSLGTSVELLGIGEALHGSEEILQVRNRLLGDRSLVRRPACQGVVTDAGRLPT